MNAWVVDEIYDVLTPAVLSVWELCVIHCRCSWYRPALIVTPEPEPSGGRGVFLVSAGRGRTDPDISRYNWLPASAPRLSCRSTSSRHTPSPADVCTAHRAGGILSIHTWFLLHLIEWGEIFTNKHIAEFAMKEKHKLSGPVSRLEDLSHDKGGETAWSQGGQWAHLSPRHLASSQCSAAGGVGAGTADHWPSTLIIKEFPLLIFIIACMISIKADRFLLSIVSVLVCDIRFITP